jgi:L-amino acid N-acyltransferase YncA
MRARPATRGDAAAIARIYNQGIEDRLATFETRPRGAADVEAWIGGVHPVVVVEEGGEVLAFAAASTYRPRNCYVGIAEFSVYAACEAAGIWKLVSRVFVENLASRGLLRTLGFREVGVYERHAKLDGAWRDVVIVERHLQ